MTNLKGDLRSIMGTPFGGVGHAVLIFSRVTRAAFDSDSVILQLHDRIEMPEEAGGKFRIEGLDPGPIRVELEGGTVHNHGWNIDLPDEGTWSLADLVDAQVDWSPAVIGRAEAAARDSRDHADRAEAAADRVGTAEQVGAWASEASASASAAASAESGAVTARNAAQSARDAAEGHANRAATSESNAAASESAAKQSETNAGDYAAVATTAATEAVDAMERATDLAGGDFATREYVDALARHYATVIMSKNMYNPAADTLDSYIGGTGGLISYAGYRTTDFIPVTPGDQYALSVARHFAFYDANRALVPDSYGQQSPQGSVVVTAPVGAVFMRMSYSVSAIYFPDNVQIEKGAAPTAYEPWYRMLDPTITVTADGGVAAVAPLRVTRAGDVIEVTSELDGKPLTQQVTLSMGRNNVLNFSRLTYNNAHVSTLNDEVTPIRTQQGTVGANHGLALMARWSAGSHDKTTADIGSIWTDGTSEFTIIDVDPAGKLFAGKTPGVVNGAATAPNSTPAADLTHVSGATNTTTIPRAGHAVTDQVAPWVQRRRQVVEVDGQALKDGEVRGHVLVLRETYEILDYGVIHAWVRANPGQRYTSVHHKAAVGVETEWRFNPGGKTRHRTALREISPTTLGNTGFMQAIALPGDVTRYLPGVGTVGGLNWDEGVDLSLLTSNLKVTSGDLLDGVPPTMAVDVRDDLGLAVALSPWKGASESSTHLAATPTNLWDLRATKKMYPNVIGSLAPGWGRIEVEGIRAYLTPSEADAIITDADPISAWVTLDHMSGQ